MKAATLLAVAGVLALPGAAPAAGSATLTVSAPAAAALEARGVTLGVRPPATLAGQTVTFPLDEAAPGSVVRQARGALRLRAGGRRVTLGSPQIVSAARITSLLGGQRTTVSTLSGKRVKLAPTAARTLARRLGVKRLPRALGTLTVEPRYTSAALPCKPTTAGGTPPDPGIGEPPVKPRPAGAIAVTSATVTWHVRESFIRYINSGEGTSADRGATSGPPAEDALVYDFGFTPTGGWCDPATGGARLTFAGSVRFSYRDHGIDLLASDPEVELDGPASRVIFRMGRRTVVETLDVSRAAAVRVDGKTFTYERIPAAVPPGAADSVFAGYYLPGEPFGWVSVTFTTA